MTSGIEASYPYQNQFVTDVTIGGDTATDGNEIRGINGDGIYLEASKITKFRTIQFRKIILEYDYTSCLTTIQLRTIL